MNSLPSPGTVALARETCPPARPPVGVETWLAVALVAAGLAAAWAWHGAGMELFVAGLGGFCL